MPLTVSTDSVPLTWGGASAARHSVLGHAARATTGVVHASNKERLPRAAPEKKRPHRRRRRKRPPKPERGGRPGRRQATGLRARAESRPLLPRQRATHTHTHYGRGDARRPLLGCRRTTAPLGQLLPPPGSTSPKIKLPDDDDQRGRERDGLRLRQRQRRREWKKQCGSIDDDDGKRPRHSLCRCRSSAWDTSVLLR